MIEFVRGKIVRAEPTAVIIDVNGIGHKIFITTGDYAQIPTDNQEITFYTSFIIRENSQSLYGFIDIRERELFEMLLTVSGIGPKTAIALISNLNIDLLQHAVEEGDTAIISKVPGIGKKTAERLIIDIRDKFSTSGKNQPTINRLKGSSKASSTLLQDAMGALINLGYNQKTAEQALKKTLSEYDSEEPPLAVLITQALRHI